MITCVDCMHPLTKAEHGYSCGCGRTYPLTEGIYDFGDKKKGEAYFPEDAFDDLYEAESRNFWFRVRNIIIGDALKSHLRAGSQLLEVGCGTGYVSGCLKQLGYRVSCGDVSLMGLKYCTRRDSGNSYYRFDILDPLFSEEFDSVCAFDVIEHIEDDVCALKNMHAALKAGGLLVLTVPASKRLWSAADEGIGHKRRYSTDELREKVESTGFKVLKLSYFMTFLLPFIAVSRAYGRLKPPSKGKKRIFDELHLNPAINELFYLIFRLETPLIKATNLPFGSSILCVVEKRRR